MQKDVEEWAAMIAQMQDDPSYHLVYNKKGVKGKDTMDETIKAVEEAKKEADKLMMNKISEYETRMAELLEQDNAHQKLNGKMQLRINELEQDNLELHADNKKLSNQVNDQIDQMRKMNSKVDELRKNGLI